MLVKNIPLSKWGNSHGIRIGNDILNELHVNSENLEFVVEVKHNQIILTPKRVYPQTLEEVFKDYEGEPLGKEDKYDWGESVGREWL